MTARLDRVSWAVGELGTALEHVARRAGLSHGSLRQDGPSRVVADCPDARARWIEAAAEVIGLEVEEKRLGSADLLRQLSTLVPALIEFDGPGGIRYFAVMRSNGRRLELLGSDLRIHPVTIEQAAEWLFPTANPSLNGIAAVLAEAGIALQSGVRAGSVLQQALGVETPVAICLAIRAPAGRPFIRQLRDSGNLGRLAALAAAHATQYSLLVLAWAIVGRSALEGRFDAGWAAAWVLVLLTLIPIRLFETWASGLAAIGIGGLLRRRLLAGVLKLDPDEIRHKGAGQFLASVFESEAVEAMAVGGGLLGLVSAIELVAALVVLALGAGGSVHALLLVVWTVLGILMGMTYFARRRSWTRARLDMTDDLVERLLGHRTRLAQEAPERWHDGEEQRLEDYLARSQAIDRVAAPLVALVSRGWLVVGMLGLVPAFAAGRASTEALAVGLGGTLAAWRAFEKLAQSLAQLAAAKQSWTEIAPVFQAAARPGVAGRPDIIAAPSNGDRLQRRGDSPAALEADHLVFRYAEHAEPVLRHCTVRIDHGDRVLLQGPSGGGKSTLASVLVGLRAPESGLLLFDGLDRPTLGDDGWRRRAVAAPQFHENHVLEGSLAFNLLMGRCWPAGAEDFAEAEAVCRELGLGGLVDRMPSGLLQMVGEAGWRLSHGERSRLFIARALLQQADLVVLDESFAALDPETLQSAMRCVLARAPTLVVIAHP